MYAYIRTPGRHEHRQRISVSSIDASFGEQDVSDLEKVSGLYPYCQIFYKELGGRTETGVISACLWNIITFMLDIRAANFRADILNGSREYKILCETMKNSL